MTKFISLFTLFLMPLMTFAQETTTAPVEYKFTFVGMLSMIITCSIIIIWNIVCFSKIISVSKKHEL